MISKDMFIVYVNNARELNKLFDDIGDVFNVILEQPYEYVCNILESIELESGIMWSDDTWDKIYNSKVPATNIYIEILKEIEESKNY